MNTRPTFYSRCVALTFTSAWLAAQPMAQSATSDFANRTQWTPCVQGSGVHLAPSGQSFATTYSADAQPTPGNGLGIAAGYISTFAMRGDFTMDIDYTLTTWPADSGVRLGLDVWPSICMIREGAGPYTHEQYTFGAGPFLSTPTSAQRGSLRLVRTGGTLLGYYRNSSGGSWVLVGSRSGDPVFTNDFQVFVSSWTDSSTFGQKPVGITLGNFALTADTTLLGPFGVPSWAGSPAITQQPQNLTVAPGAVAVFDVAASGLVPLDYQWRFDGAIMRGATGATLVLSNVQPANAGLYSVLVSNQWGAVTSSTAVLTLNGAGGCATPPIGLAGWWKGDGTAGDSMGLNNGTLVGNVTYGPGEVGQAFVFGGSGAAVSVGTATNLQLQDFTVESWIRRSDTSRASQDPWGSGAIFCASWGGYGFAVWDDGQLVLTKIGYDGVESTQRITDTNYHHVAVTKDGSAVSFYVDGNAEVAAPYDPGFVFINGGFAIGARGADFVGSLLGSVDEVSVYNRALGTGEIRAIYSAGSAGKCAVPVSPSPALVQAASTLVSGGASFVLPVVLVANGNENALGFTLDFDPSLLTCSGVNQGAGAAGATLVVNTNHAASGEVGVELALPPATTFPPGTQQVAQVWFTAAPVTNAATASIAFGDQVILRQLSDASGVNPLPVNFVGGTVSISLPSFEGDVSPRPNGDGLLTVSDWVLEGRYVARLDYPTNASEFQRADCAPRSLGGDGLLTVSDWVQVGRYSAGLDPMTPVGEFPGGASPDRLVSPAPQSPAPKGQSVRRLDVLNTTVLQGQTGAVSVVLVAQGNENALGFTLCFDPNALAYVSASPGSGVSGATFIVNATKAASGQLGFALALGTDITFPGGTTTVVTVTFAASTTASRSYSLTLTDQVVVREISDAGASPLTAEFNGGSISIPAPALAILPSAQNLVLSWPAWAGRYILQEATGSLGPGTVWSNVSITPTAGVDDTFVTLPSSHTNTFYRLIER